MARSIVPNQTFLHGRDRYEAGKTYEVSSKEAAYFQAQGWVDGGAALDGDQDVTLDIEPSTVGTHAKEPI